MEFTSERKGITPVIAIVLLLMVTVGAVGVVYTQFQSLVGDPTEDIDQQQRNQDTNIRILRGGTNLSSIDTSGNHNITNYGVTYLEIQNTGSVARNMSSFMIQTSSADHVIGEDAENVCTQGSNATVLNPDETMQCFTGIVFPQATNEIEFTVQLTGSGKSWSYICRPESQGSTLC
jgi:flagellin-like protein